MVGTTADTAGERGLVARLGLQHGNTVQEFGWDDDVDEAVRVAIQDTIDAELLDEDTDDVADAVLLWWREDDGDLIDALVDALTNLAEGGFIVLLTPKAGRDGHVDASDIQEATLTAGLHASGSANAAGEWNGHRLVAPKTDRR